MNIKSLLVSFALVLGGSSAALAKPASYSVQAGFTVDASLSLGSTAVRDHREPRPVVVRDHREPRPVVVRDHRAPDRGWMKIKLPKRPFEPVVTTSNTKLYEANGHRWSEYSGPIYTRNGHGYSFKAITDATRIGQNRQDFWLKGAPTNAIQLRAVAGSTFVTSVLVEFGPGTKPQVVQVNRDLRDGAITIDLEGDTRSVFRIGVGGTSGSNSAYQILAR